LRLASIRATFLTVLHVGVVGDYDPGNETHRATDAALVHAAAALGTAAIGEWVATEKVASGGTRELEGFDCVVVAPGSPYRSTQGALEAIRHARTSDVPLLGTCGGFQHIVLEFARNVLGYDDADHAELNSEGSRLFITPLSCSLVGQTMPVHLEPGSLAASAYDRTEVPERYYCNFGLNPEYLDELVAGGLEVTGTGPEGEPRVIELPGLRFFMGTLFVPQASSTASSPPPLLMALLEAAQKG
jgi:CTP synthase (UTP-ammonia lyase)